LDKPTILVFNKIDAYQEKINQLDPTDLEHHLPTLDEMKKTWLAKSGHPTVFISAAQKVNIDELKQVMYNEIKSMHLSIYPHKLLW
jgi:GTP-binding protein HflX